MRSFNIPPGYSIVQYTTIRKKIIFGLLLTKITNQNIVVKFKGNYEIRMWRNVY